MRRTIDNLRYLAWCVQGDAVQVQSVYSEDGETATIGSLGEPVESPAVPRVGDRVHHHQYGEFEVLAVLWWPFGGATVSLLVKGVEKSP